MEAGGRVVVVEGKRDDYAEIGKQVPAGLMKVFRSLNFPTTSIHCRYSLPSYNQPLLL